MEPTGTSSTTTTFAWPLNASSTLAAVDGSHHGLKGKSESLEQTFLVHSWRAPVKVFTVDGSLNWIYYRIRSLLIWIKSRRSAVGSWKLIPWQMPDTGCSFRGMEVTRMSMHGAVSLSYQGFHAHDISSPLIMAAHSLKENLTSLRRSQTTGRRPMHIAQRLTSNIRLYASLLA